jgi:hypothetical protein
MPQRPETFNPGTEDPEATLVTPRFDAEEARRAHPVVPLAEVPARHAPHARRERTQRRAWTPALLAVALLVVAAVGGAVTTQFMRSPRAQQGQTQAAPVQAAEAPPQPSTPAVAEASPPAVAEAPREDTPAASPTPRSARTRRARAATTLAAESARGAADDDEDEELREVREEIRRERAKEMRKASKRAKERAKDKAPRLVDVLTPRP